MNKYHLLNLLLHAKKQLLIDIKNWGTFVTQSVMFMLRKNKMLALGLKHNFYLFIQLIV